MANLKDIRKRIGSVKNTQKITRAMKMVAAAKLRRAQERLQASRPYAHKMSDVIASLSEGSDESTHPLLQRRDEQNNILLVIVSSNRGLCGGFNSKLFRTIDLFITQHKALGKNIHVITIGNKASSYYKRREDVTIYKDYPDIIGQVDYKKAKKVAQGLMEDFISTEFDAVHLCFNKFISAIAYDGVVQPLLPLATEDEDAAANQSDQADAAGGAEIDYIYEPDVQSLLAHLLPGHIEVQLLQALFESEAAEHGARMTSMDNATNNASDMISKLTLQYNRARQAAITREICEIVSGAESLKG